MYRPYMEMSGVAGCDMPRWLLLVGRNVGCTKCEMKTSEYGAHRERLVLLTECFYNCFDVPVATRLLSSCASRYVETYVFLDTNIIKQA